MPDLKERESIITKIIIIEDKKKLSLYHNKLGVSISGNNFFCLELISKVLLGCFEIFVIFSFFFFAISELVLNDLPKLLRNKNRNVFYPALFFNFKQIIAG